MPATMNVPARVSQGLQPLFSPFRALRDEMEDLITRFSADWSAPWLTTAFKPATDLSETADTLQIRMDVPGIKPDDISVDVTGNTVRISGERKEEKEEKGKTYHRVQRRTGTFCESLTLPCRVREDKVHAEFTDGVLTITLPKCEEAKTHKVKIKSHGNGGGK